MRRLLAATACLNALGLLAWTWGVALPFDLVQFLAVQNALTAVLTLTLRR